METERNASAERSKPCSKTNLQRIRSLRKLRLTLSAKLLFWLLSDARYIANFCIFLIDRIWLLCALGLLFRLCQLSFVFFDVFKHLLYIGLAFSSRLNSDPFEHPNVSFTQIQNVWDPYPSLFPLASGLFLINNRFLRLNNLNQSAVVVRILFRCVLVSAESNALILHDFALFHCCCGQLRHSCVLFHSLLSSSHLRQFSPLQGRAFFKW